MSDQRDKNDEFSDDEYSFIKEKIKKEPLNKRRIFVKIGSTALLAVLFGMVVLVTFYALGPKVKGLFEEEETPPEVKLPVVDPEPEEDEENEENQSADSTADTAITDYKTMYSELYEISQKANKAIVKVTCVRNVVDWYDKPYDESNETTGLIFTHQNNEIYIMTDQDSIQDADSIHVTFNNGNSAEAALRKYDGNTGIAIITVEADYNSIGEITEAVIGNSNYVKQGELVIALGNPQGYSDAIGYGVVTSKTNTISVYDGNYKILTTDINGSSSGNGVLINLNGEVIGVIAQQYNNGENKNNIICLGVTDILDIIEMLMSSKDIPYTGIKGVTVTDTLAEENGLVKGVYVTDFELSDSPALRAGINKGDIITEFNGEEIKSIDDYRDNLLASEPGQILKLTIQREGNGEYEEITLDLEVGVLY